jgi:hypothetical protein
MLFWIECNAKKKSTEMTLYEDIPGTKVGGSITLELADPRPTSRSKARSRPTNEWLPLRCGQELQG